MKTKNVFRLLCVFLLLVLISGASAQEEKARPWVGKTLYYFSGETPLTIQQRAGCKDAWLELNLSRNGLSAPEKFHRIEIGTPMKFEWDACVPDPTDIQIAHLREFLERDKAFTFEVLERNRALAASASAAHGKETKPAATVMGSAQKSISNQAAPTFSVQTTTVKKVAPVAKSAKTAIVDGSQPINSAMPANNTDALGAQPEQQNLVAGFVPSGMAEAAAEIKKLNGSPGNSQPPTAANPDSTQSAKLSAAAPMGQVKDSFAGAPPRKGANDLSFFTGTDDLVDALKRAGNSGLAKTLEMNSVDARNAKSVGEALSGKLNWSEIANGVQLLAIGILGFFLWRGKDRRAKHFRNAGDGMDASKHPNLPSYLFAKPTTPAWESRDRRSGVRHDDADEGLKNKPAEGPVQPNLQEQATLTSCALEEAKSKLTETSRALEEAKSKLTEQEGLLALAKRRLASSETTSCNLRSILDEVKAGLVHDRQVEVEVDGEVHQCKVQGSELRRDGRFNILVSCPLCSEGHLAIPEDATRDQAEGKIREHLLRCSTKGTTKRQLMAV